MFCDLNICCRLCSKIFCCFECRIKHELDIHSVNDKPDMLPKLENLLITSNFNRVRSISHILKHFPSQCLKCLMMFLFDANNKNSSKCICKPEVDGSAEKKNSVKDDPLTSFAEDSYKISKTDMFYKNNIKKENLETKSTNKNNLKSKSFNFKKDLAYKMNDTFEGNIKVFRTTSTPMQKFVWFPDNNASHSPSGTYNSEIISDISHSKSTTNFVKTVTKESIYQISKNSGVLSTRSPAIQNIAENINDVRIEGYKNSPLDLRTSAVLMRNYSCPSIKIYDKEHPSRSCELTKYYSFSTKRMMESLYIKSALLKNASLSMQLEQEIDIYGSFRSMELVSSEAINPEKIGLKTKYNFFQKQQTPFNNSIQITPKCRKGLEKKVIDFKTQDQCKELDENDIFYTPSSSFPESITPKHRNIKDKNLNQSEFAISYNNRENFGTKIWDVFSSLIRFPSFNKENYPKDVRGSDFVSKDNLDDNHLDCLKSKNIDILAKRKRDSYEDSVTCSNVKRIKLISGRKPLDSYRKRIDTPT